MLMGMLLRAADDFCLDGDQVVQCETPEPLLPTGSEIGLGFGVLLLIGLLMFGAVIALGVIGVVWQRRKAADIARKAGMDVDAAMAVAMTEGGLQSTYLAAQLRDAGITAPPAPSAEQRLRELQGLLDQGLITQAEFDERRAAIINSV